MTLKSYRTSDMDCVCEGSSAPLKSCSISSHQACVMSSWRVRVMCAGAPMSFHSSFHFKALFMLAQRYEVWISYLPLPQVQSVPRNENHMSWQFKFLDETSLMNFNWFTEVHRLFQSVTSILHKYI